MHKYQPRVHIAKTKCSSTAAVESDLRSIDAHEFRTFLFPETVFIGVTAYQNQLVNTFMAVQNNDFTTIILSEDVLSSFYQSYC